MSDLLLAVEAGGTKFRAAITGLDQVVRDETRIETTTPDQTIGNVIDFASGHKGIVALGIASFGPVILDRNAANYGAIGATPKPHWSGAPLLTRLTDALGVPGDIQTDVEAAAIAEQSVGAAAGQRSVAYVTVGTGIGAAVAVDGVPQRGRSHSELGHIPVRRNPNDDYVGHCPFHADCLEGMASGPALGDRWNVTSASKLNDVDEAWVIEADYLAQLVRVLNYAYAPDKIVFGGGVGARPDLLERLRSRVGVDLADYAVHHDDPANLVVGAALPDAGMTGATLLAHALAVGSGR